MSGDWLFTRGGQELAATFKSIAHALHALVDKKTVLTERDRLAFEIVKECVRDYDLVPGYDADDTQAVDRHKITTVSLLAYDVVDEFLKVKKEKEGC